MPAAGVVMLIAVVLIVARARLLPRLDDRRAAPDHRGPRRGDRRRGRDHREERAGRAGRERRSTPTSTPASTCSRACSSRRPGMSDAVGLVDGLYPGAARGRASATSPTAPTIKPPRIAEVYTRGTLTLARLGREAPIAAASPDGPGAAQHRGGSLAARAALPRDPPVAARRTCRARRSSAPTRPSSTSARRPAPRKRLPGGRDGRKEPDADPGAVRVRARDQRRGRDRVAAAARRGRADHRRRPQPAADDEAAAREPRAPVDINDLDELAYIREEGGEIRIGALTRHVDLLDSELLAARFPLFRDAEEVIADPVVRNRGTIGGSLCQADAAEDLSAVCAAAKAERRDPRRRRRARRRDGRLPRRPVHDRGRRRRAAHRGPAAAARRRRQRAREGRAPRRRLGDRRGVGGALARRRRDRRRRHRAQRGRPHDDPPHPRGGAAAGPGAVGGAVRAGGRDRRRRTARRPPTAAARSTTSATSPACSPRALRRATRARSAQEA